MKLALLIFALVPLIARAEPSLAIDQALKLAQENLKERGLTGQVYITAITLDRASVAQASGAWTIKWSQEIALEGEKKESGLEIAMDGTVARVVRGPANRNPVTGNFDPNGRKGLENHRTRSDRPSVLDLKH